MVNRRLSLLTAITVMAMVLIASAESSCAEKPIVLKPCVQCHQQEQDLFRGTLVSVTERFKTINVQVGQKLVWIITYGDDLKIIGADKLSAIPKDKEIGVRFTGGEKKPYAVSLTVKPPAQVAPEKLVSLGEMVKLVAEGPEKGNYLLVDSRPKPRYLEGHIPGALSLPTDKFDELKDTVLPSEKDKLVISYCGGVTRRLSPDSARRAEAAGYTKAKIFHDGLTAWKKSGNLIVSEPAALQDFIEKDIAHVVVDLRDGAAVKNGFIRGAVAIPANELLTAKDHFPDDKSAPIVLYSDGVGSEAFKTVRSWGYKDTSILNGGMAAWTKAGGKLETVTPGTIISYVPKPRPGEISIEEFKAIAERGSPGMLIRDVRDTDEAMNGMLAGAINSTAGNMTKSLKDLPRDKEIITYCNTGLRGESAYEELKQSGYKFRFLNALIQIDKDGKYEITKK